MKNKNCNKKTPTVSELKDECVRLNYKLKIQEKKCRRLHDLNLKLSNNNWNIYDFIVRKSNKENSRLHDTNLQIANCSNDSYSLPF